MKPQQLTDQKIKPKKELTARRMLWANYRAMEGGKALRYTKKHYENAKGCTAQAMIKWNKFFPKADQFTEDEITESRQERKKQSQ
tara:strand:+ start:387 stop:641 length:255 start_codon:yes stop_codon:yes gene_type:complete